MKRNMKEWMYQILNTAERKAMPVLSFPGLELIQKNVSDIVNNGKCQYDCMKAVSKEFPSAAAVTVMDLSVEAEAFGSPVEFLPMETPNITSKIVDDWQSVSDLQVPDVGKGRTGEFIIAAELAAQGIKDRPVFGGMIGPFSLAGRLFDITEIMLEMLVEPDTVHLLLQKCNQFLVEYAKAFKKAGANGIVIAEPAAGLISPQHCQEFSSDYLQSIVSAVQDDYFMVILHNCGNTENLVPSMLSTGAMGYHFGNAVDMTKIMPQIPWGKIAMGNIDPAGILKEGNEEEIREKTWKLLLDTAIYKNFVLSSGCDVPPETPLKHIQIFYETLERFNRMVMSENIA